MGVELLECHATSIYCSFLIFVDKTQMILLYMSNAGHKPLRNERAWPIVLSRAQCGLETSHAPFSF